MSRQFPEKSSGGSVLGVIFFLSSASIGAGILGLPIQTGLAGTIPTFIAMSVVWFILLFCAFFIADIYLENENYDSDIPDILQRPLGWFGKVFGTVGYLLNAYGILVAYIAGSGPVLKALFESDAIPQWGYFLFFLVPAIIATLAGQKLVTKANGLLMGFILCSFGILLWFAFSHSEPSRWIYTDWKYAPVCFSIILTAFVIHNLVPSVCRYLNRDRQAVRKALFWGMMIPFIVNFLWLLAIVGALPLTEGNNSILSAFKAGNPATVPLEIITSSKFVATSAAIFSLTAIFTSFTATGLGLKAFFKDLLKIPETKKGFALSALIVFLPPVLVVFIDPSIFIKALDLVGGVAVSLVYGILPCLIIIVTPKFSKHKKLALSFLIIFVFIMLLEIVRQTGLVHFNFSN